MQQSFQIGLKLLFALLRLCISFCGGMGALFKRAELFGLCGEGQCLLLFPHGFLFGLAGFPLLLQGRIFLQDGTGCVRFLKCLFCQRFPVFRRCFSVQDIQMPLPEIFQGVRRDGAIYLQLPLQPT